MNATPIPSTGSTAVATQVGVFKEIGICRSRNLPSRLRQLQASLLVGASQAGRLLRVRDDKLHLSFHSIDRPIRVTANRRSIVIRARNQVWLLRSAAEIAARFLPIARGKVARYRS